MSENREEVQADYKEMYLTMARETEKAIRILIAVQKKCEELYIDAGENAPSELRTGESSEKP